MQIGTKAEFKYIRANTHDSQISICSYTSPTEWLKWMSIIFLVGIVLVASVRNMYEDIVTIGSYNYLKA